MNVGDLVVLMDLQLQCILAGITIPNNVLVSVISNLFYTIMGHSN